MKLSPELEAAFNKQVTYEFAASMVYRQLAIEVEQMDLPGMANWLRRQADEEIVHANKFIDHLADRGNRPVIGAIAQPQVPEGDSVKDIFDAALQHEQKVSESIRELYRAAEKDGDLDSRPLLNWFLSEQIEEEAVVSEIVGRVRLVADDGPGLLRLDQELSSRPLRPTEPTAAN
ncbi:MAG: ferritin [Propionibacterium sp.]|nr:ferritin [Propionibacterium sp.]